MFPFHANDVSFYSIPLEGNKTQAISAKLLIMPTKSVKNQKSGF